MSCTRLAKSSMQSFVEFKSKDRDKGHFNVEYGPGNAEILL